jgi:hypothetical protein
MDDTLRTQSGDFLKPQNPDVLKVGQKRASSALPKPEIILETSVKSDHDRSTSSIIELEGINDLFNLLDLEMDREINCFFYKGQKYKLNVPTHSNSAGGLSMNLFASTIPKAIAKRMSAEDKDIDIKLASSYGKSDDINRTINQSNSVSKGTFHNTHDAKQLKFNHDVLARELPVENIEVRHEIKTLNNFKTPEELAKEFALMKLANKESEQLHLAVLYSSPLGYEEADSKGGTKFKSLQELSFVKDIERITSSLENSNKLVNYSINIGNPMNFIAALSKNPYILHFIGHGIKTSHFYKKEDYLVLENDDGSGQLVSSTKLKMIIDVCNSKLDTVFLSS